MASFNRTVALALKNRGTLLGVVFSSLLVGVLWGGNIGIIYPFVQIVLRGQSLHQWIDSRIETAATASKVLRDELRQFEAMPAAGADGTKAERHRLFLQSRL